MLDCAIFILTIYELVNVWLSRQWRSNSLLVSTVSEKMCKKGLAQRTTQFSKCRLHFFVWEETASLADYLSLSVQITLFQHLQISKRLPDVENSRMIH